VAVKVDETSHRGTLGLASMHPSPRYEGILSTAPHWKASRSAAALLLY
jgi:hypothetical protein